MHADLSPVANLLVKAAMTMASTLGAKVFTIILPSYGIFRDVVQNLLNDFQPKWGKWDMIAISHQSWILDNFYI